MHTDTQPAATNVMHAAARRSRALPGRGGPAESAQQEGDEGNWQGHVAGGRRPVPQHCCLYAGVALLHLRSLLRLAGRPAAPGMAPLPCAAPFHASTMQEVMRLPHGCHIGERQRPCPAPPSFCTPSLPALLPYRLEGKRALPKRSAAQCGSATSIGSTAGWPTAFALLLGSCCYTIGIAPWGSAFCGGLNA